MTRREKALSILNECDKALEQNLGPLYKSITPVERAAFYKDAYPWGERKYHPYKVWLATIKEHLADLKKLQEFGES